MRERNPLTDPSRLLIHPVLHVAHTDFDAANIFGEIHLAITRFLGFSGGNVIGCVNEEKAV